MSVAGSQVPVIRAERALAVGAVLGEGPVWDADAQELYFVDILAGTVHAFRPRDGAHRCFGVGRAVGAVVLREDGGLLLAAHDGFLLAARDGSGLAAFGAFRAQGAFVRFNDGKVDPAGRLVVGTMHHGEREPFGALHLLHPDGRVVTLLEAVTISNGLAWSDDGGVLYFIDSAERRVDAFDVEPATGALSGRRAVVELHDGIPDGMAIDDEGCLWVALFGGSRVERVDPIDGRRLAVVEVPASQVTSVAFGGPGLDELYVTTARRGLDAAALEREPFAGDLFVAHPGVTGPLPGRFAGPLGVAQ